MNPAARLRSIPPYPFARWNLEVNPVRPHGTDVIRLDIGSPDMPPPDEIIEPLCRSAHQPDRHGYPGYRGTPALRGAIAEYYARRFDVELDPDTQVVPLLGSKEGIVNMTLACIDPGDLALVPDPGYAPYTMGTILAGAEVRTFPLLAERGMIYSVGEGIIKDVARFIHSGESGKCRVSINLSARQCGQAGLGDFIQGVVDEYEIDPTKLEFELTESMLLDDFERARELINQLQKMGCTIALDDFGTGYTSMSYLTQLNIDVIKIDRSFVTSINNDDNLRKIVYAIIGMSQSLEIENVIEGVENRDELATIQALGGNIIQGYLYSRPLKRGDELAKWLADN